MTDRELTGITVNQVQADCKNNVDADKDNVQLPEGTNDFAKEQALYDTKNDNAGNYGFKSNFLIAFIPCHLRLSHEHSCLISRKVYKVR